MILRKPYAILIKNFKLIHVILAILMGYLFYKTNMILSFLNEYLSSIATTITNEVTSSLFGSTLIITIILVILGSLILLSLMHFKDKPIKFYAYNIICYILLAVFYYISFTTIKSLEVGLVDVRVLKVIHDLTIVILAFQMMGLIFVIVRATGFDIKSFDFKKDLEELNIVSSDSEEFEVELELDTDKLKRKINKKFRHAKYIYIENKLLINIVGSILCAILFFAIYLNVGVYNKTFKLNEAFKTNQFIFNFINSYYTKYDYAGKEIKENYEIVAVRLKIRKLYTQELTLQTGKFYLDVNGRKFHHTTNYKDRLFDLGTTYISQQISNEFTTYLLVFEIPTSMIDEKMILKYSDTNNDIVKIDVTPNSLNKKQEETEASLTETLMFENSTLNTTSIKINSYELAPSFKINYNYCLNKETCYESVEYLKPGTNSNYSTILLKINGEFITQNPISKVKDLFDFIQYFGKIKYEINGEYKTMDMNLLEVTPKKTKTEDFYIEVNSELADASKVDILFNIRNKIYTYHLK